MKLPTTQLFIAMAMSLAVATVCVRAQTTSLPVPEPPAQEMWQADLVISSVATEDPTTLNFPNDFVDNPLTSELLVVDTWNNRILRYTAATDGATPAGTFKGVITAPGQKEFVSPYGAAVDGAGNIVVADTGNGLIRVLSPDGSVELKRVDLTALELGSAPSSPGRVALAPPTDALPGGTFLDPTGAVQGYVYVVDGANHLVAVLDAHFNLVTKFFGGLQTPTGLAVDRQGRVYVSDPNNVRVEVFADPLLTPHAEPEPLAKLCDYGGCTVMPGFAYPFGLALDANGRLLVADSDNNRIVVFSSFADGLQPVSASIGVANTGVNGPSVDGWNLPDSDPTGLILPDDAYGADLQAPTNIEIDHLGHLLVADSSNMRVQRFVQPTMTLTASVSAPSFITGNTIRLTVVAATTEPLGLINVTPIASPLNTTALCGNPASAGLVSSPTGYQVNGGPISLTPPPPVSILPGEPVTFTIMFTAGSGSGPVVFSVGAEGTLTDGRPSSQHRTLDSIAINDTGLPPVSSVSTLTPANGAPSPAGSLGWFNTSGTTDPTVVHLSAANANEVEWSITDQNPLDTTPDTSKEYCGTMLDVPIAPEGGTLLWYRSVAASGQTEPWHKVTIYRSFGPALSMDLSGNLSNSWYKGPVTVDWQATDTVAGLGRIDWTASGGVSGSNLSPASPTTASSFVVSTEGAGVSASLTATSIAGSTSQVARTFNIDSTAPSVSSIGTFVNGAASPTPAVANGAGWYNTALDVVFTATDALSGFAAADVAAGATDNHTARKTVTVNGDGNLNAAVPFTDLAGNYRRASIGVKIDTTAPVFAVVPPDVTATSAWNVTYPLPTATDATSKVKSVTCLPASGSHFASGSTTVTCTATDNADNTAITSFVVTVTVPADTVAPVIAPHDPVSASASSAAGALVPYTSPATSDAIDGPGTASCLPASNSLFALGTTTVTCTASDAARNAATPTTFTVTVAPTAVSDAYSVNEDGTLSIGAAGVLANDPGFNATAPNLTAVRTSGPLHGSLTLNANGSFTYRPNADYNGSDSFSYSASFGTAISNVATVAITVTAVNDAPVAVADNFSSSEDTNLSGNVLTNDTDIDTARASLTAALVSGPTQGTLISFNANGSFVYKPNGNYNGIDTFTYKVNDGQLPSNTATVTITVTPVNDAPVANNLTIAVTQGQSVNGQMLATDIDGPALTYAITASPASGTITSFNTASGAFTYKANANAPLADSFTITVSDGTLTSPATVSVTISPSNASPVCTAASADQATLWPPNHKFVAIGINGVTDPDHDAISIAVNRIWQDESTMADGSGDTPTDGVIVNKAAQLRAERAGQGDGRVYEIFFTATDAKGAACTGSVKVAVPHDQGGPAARDSGVRYDSLVTNGPPIH